jgi:PAS domain S-box-containing protein
MNLKALRLNWAATCSGALVALIGAGYLAAWWVGNYDQSGFHTLTMKSNIALSLVLSGLAVSLMAFPWEVIAQQWLVRACALIALLIGALTLCEILFGWNLSIDQLMATELPGAVQTTAPNRMSVLSAAGCAMAGIAILLFTIQHRSAAGVAQKLALAVLLIGSMGAIDSIYDAFLTNEHMRIAGIATPTAIAFLVLGSAMLFLRPREGLMASVTAADIGGHTIRSVLPWCVALPLLIGYLHLFSERAGIYRSNPSMGGTLLALTFICVFSFITYLRGVAISRTESAERLNRRVLARQAALIDLSPYAIIVLDGSGTINFWSKGAEKLYGWSQEEALHQNIHRLLSTQFPEALENLIGQVQDGCNWKGELAQKTKDGRPIIVQSHWHGEATDNGFEILESNIDITERKSMELSIKASEEKFRRIYESNILGITYWHKDGRLTEANKAYCDLIGCAPEEVNSGVFSWHGFVTPEMFDKAQEFIRKTNATGYSEPSEYEFTNSMGRRITALAGGAMLGGIKDQGVAFVLDISARKRAEEALRESEKRYRNLFKSMDEGVAVFEVLFDPNGLPNDLLFRQVNPAFKLHSGLNQVVGKTIRELGFKLEPGWHDAFLKLLETGETIRMVKYSEWLHRWFDLCAFRIGKRKHGNLAILFRNITEHKKMEDELASAKESAERAKAAAENANRTKDRFLAATSHELRTPLTSILIGISMLQNKKGIDPYVRETLGIIRDNAEIEGRLIDELLDVMRIESGKIDLHRSPVELSTIIQRAVNICKSDIEASSLHLGVDMGREGEYWIQADAVRLQQVFWNLLKNAVKFTSRGGSIGIHCRQDDNHVLVEVNDTGIGIDSELLSSIFNAFEQAGRNRQFGGLGLGLAISKAIVEMHEGTITAYSKGRGAGASFIVELPLTAPVRSDISEKLRVPQYIHPLNILLVEDHKVSAKMMSQALISEGHNVEIKGTLADALESANQQSFNLLLSDLGLPDGTGYELLKQLRSRGRYFPAIALSGYGQEEDIQRSYQSGFTVHITKPVSREKLMEAVMSAVPQAKKIRVLLVDDHEAFRRGIARLLKSEPDVEIAGEAGDGESAVDLTRTIKPDVVLMDIYMPRMDGIQATRIIHRELPEVRVIALSMKERSESAGAIEEAGAVCYLTKAESTSEAMISAIRACA